ncbi:hypothetical protein AN640_00150 [Candidatus Epulonipiscium fishelsonii]|uniref:Uncharacterized protein n=1 Tax=Candidatus Epulonipiscium fishelsonii TaxID=77094 RepID=A0ACC8XIB1_9FIRM|nr:hypothetical protein AN640_00150 [Epulopiscium sp. SCG-D08WGA-EpuloA1]OON97436.1 MAG: hypothetical protein ATN32_05510 [Epulopiscium sp. AS2M-Bin002]
MLDIVNAINSHAQVRPYDIYLLLITAISTVCSAVAIWQTIKISDRQNKIILFEERYKVYEEVLQCLNISQCVEAGILRDTNLAKGGFEKFNNSLIFHIISILMTDSEDFRTIVDQLYRDINHWSNFTKSSYKIMKIHWNHVEVLNKIEFLFDREISNNFKKVFIENGLIQFMFLENEEEQLYKAQTFVSLSNEFRQNELTKMGRYLTLKVK